MQFKKYGINLVLGPTKKKEDNLKDSNAQSTRNFFKIQSNTLFTQDSANFLTGTGDGKSVNNFGALCLEKLNATQITPQSAISPLSRIDVVSERKKRLHAVNNAYGSKSKIKLI